MAALVGSGRIVDLILLLVVAEAAGLCAWSRLRGSGPRQTALLANMASGACLLLALRAGLGGADWPWIAAALLGALVAHLIDLRLRWR